MQLLALLAERASSRAVVGKLTAGDTRRVFDRLTFEATSTIAAAEDRLVADEATGIVTGVTLIEGMRLAFVVTDRAKGRLAVGTAAAVVDMVLASHYLGSLVGLGTFI